MIDRSRINVGVNDWMTPCPICGDCGWAGMQFFTYDQIIAKARPIGPPVHLTCGMEYKPDLDKWIGSCEKAGNLPTMPFRETLSPGDKGKYYTTDED